MSAKFNSLFTFILFLLYSVVGFSACGGGGSGGGGGGGGADANTRTNGTSIRVLHGAFDVEPVDVKIGDQYVTRVPFMVENFFQSTDSGLLPVIIEKANTPGASFFANQIQLNEKTEYTFLLSGQAGHGNFAITTIEEPVSRPDQGQARVQLVNLLEASSPLTLTGGGVTLGPVAFRLASDSVTLPAGAHNFLITNARGVVIANITPTLADRGEATVVVGGDLSAGVRITKVFTDLD